MKISIQYLDYRVNKAVLGLGLLMSRALASNGAKKVYILGRRKNILDQAVADIVASPKPRYINALLMSSRAMIT